MGKAKFPGKSPAELVSDSKGGTRRVPGHVNAPVGAQSTPTTLAQQKMVAQAANNGMGTGSIVSNLTGGQVRTDPNTGRTIDPRDPATLKATQSFLRAKGYNITLDGKWGPQTQSAIADWTSGVGKRNPQAWTAKNNPLSAPYARPSTSTDVTDTSSAPPGKTPGKMPPRDTTGAGGRVPLPGFTPVDTSYISQMQGYDPNAADAQAGLQFDPQIQMTKLLQSRGVTDAAQHQKDITNWFGQVQAAQQTAAARDATAGDQAVKSTGDAVAGIIASLGGSANPGAATLGAQGDANTAMESQMAQAQNQYQNDLAPILKLQQASAAQNQTNVDANSQQALAQQLSSLLGQRGQAVTANKLSLQQAQNALLAQQQGLTSDATQYNNSGSQQQFQNWATVQELAQAAALNHAQVKYYGASSNPSGFLPWAKLNASQKQQLINTAMSNVTDSKGALLPQYANNKAAAWIAARNYLKGQGFNSAFKNTASDPTAYGAISALLGTAISGAAGRYGLEQQANG